MDPISGIIITGAVGGLINSVVGAVAGSEARRLAEKQLEEAMKGMSEAQKQQIKLLTQAADAIKAVGVPSEEALQVSYEKLKEGGKLSPETVNFVEMPESEFKKINADPKLKQVRLEALTKMQEQAARGITPEIEAAIRQQEAGRAQELSSATKSILEQQAARGMAGSGAGLIAQLNAAQQQANRASLDADRINSLLFSNQRDAIARAEQLAGKLSQEDIGLRSDQARAQDQINQLNSQLSNQYRRAAADARNEAQKFNLQREQYVSDFNVGLTNKERDTARQNTIWRYEQEAEKANRIANNLRDQGTAIYGGARDQADLKVGVGKAQAQGAKDVGQSVQQGVQAVGTSVTDGLGQQAADNRMDAWIKANRPQTYDDMYMGMSDEEITNAQKPRT